MIYVKLMSKPSQSTSSVKKLFKILKIGKIIEKIKEKKFKKIQQNEINFIFRQWRDFLYSHFEWEKIVEKFLKNTYLLPLNFTGNTKKQ